MTAFYAALAVLAADPNLGTDATYRAGGTGSAIVLHVLRASPDRMSDGFGTGILQVTDILTVPLAALPAIEPGDSFTFDALTLTVDSAERDAAGIAWRVLCRR